MTLPGLKLIATAFIASCILSPPVRAAGANECPQGAQLSHEPLPDGSVAMCLDPEGKLHGVATTRNSDGTVRSRDAWSHGVKDGQWETYHPNGAIRSRTEFESGAITGLSTSWFDGGQKRNFTTFVQGAREGPIAEWDDAGRQTVAGQFAEDKPAGTWIFYLGEHPKAAIGDRLKSGQRAGFRPGD
jgi:hypothetical protein